ncbi:MAG TPA: amino acid ABC transporter permease [Dongiaceae bacterium]|nr:amino acid ABC transporter permease [Dongiaceae bacterium]
MNYTFQFHVVFNQLPEFLHGALVTLELALAGFWLGAPIALLLAAARTSGPTWVRRLTGAYVTFLTNTPVLIHIFFLFYGLPEIGILLDKYTSVVIGLVMATSAYGCEIMRAGFLSVRRSEIEAAETLGFSRAQTLWNVIVPHILKTVYPALANYFIVLTLSTSMAMIVGAEELLGTAFNLASENYRHLEAFILAAGLYVIITFIASLSLAWFGRWAFRVKAKIF